MRISRIFVEHPLNCQQSLLLESKTSHYLLKVLRLKISDSLILFDGSGHDYHAEIVSIEKKAVSVSISSATEAESKPILDIHLGLGISKGDRFDLAIQKATELGISEITPLFTEYTSVKLNQDRLQKKWLHWQGIIQSACEQSGRRYIPKLHLATDISQWLAISNNSLKLVLEPQAIHVMRDFTTEKALTILAGAEGGLSVKEVAQAVQHDFKKVRLGPHILRTETAPLAAIAAAQTLWGNFS